MLSNVLYWLNVRVTCFSVQLSGDSASQTTPTRPDPSLEDELTKVKGEVAQLKSRLLQVTSERDQANSDLSALRDAMIQQQEENASKVSLHIR